MEEEGVYIVAPISLYDRAEAIQQILFEAYSPDDLSPERDRQESQSPDDDYELDEEEEARYLLILSPRNHFLWSGRVMMLDIPRVDLDPKDDRVRLVADGTQRHLAFAKQVFKDIFEPIDEDGRPIDSSLRSPLCITEAQAHFPSVDRELRKIGRSAARLAESVVDSVHIVRSALRSAQGYQELMENWYLFASEHGQQAQRYMDRSSLLKFNRLLVKLAISWVSFICDDCEPTDRKTFKWAVNALEFTLHRTKRNILHLPNEQFEMLRAKIATCMTLLINHFDILGAKSLLEAKREKEKHRELATDDEDDFSAIDPNSAFAHIDPSTRFFWQRVTRLLLEREEQRVINVNVKVGRVLDDQRPEDRSLVFLASSSSSISIRWQQGRFIGAGAFGSVYLAVNLDSGSLMAVKEIKFQELTGMPNLYAQIKDELSVMEMLHHPNVVEYYGIEVHRDRVYIFEEYCQGGSLAQLLEHGRIEDEGIIQVYTMQMLEGLAYLHSQGIIHRDIKPDSEYSRTID
jgi:mitogen-activated protein kinase kinase kinase